MSVLQTVGKPWIRLLPSWAFLRLLLDGLASGPILAVEAARHLAILGYMQKLHTIAMHCGLRTFAVQP